MSEVFKNFKSGEKKLTTAVTHKEWKITKVNSGSYGFGHFPECNFASNINFNPQDPNFGNNTIESTIDGASGIGTQTQYKKLIHDSIHHLYIRGNDNPYDVFCNDTPHLDYREEHGSVHVFSIPSSIFGERIKPGSVTISSSFYHVKDDGYGNLYDPNNYTGSVIRNLPSQSMLHLPFSDGYRYMPNYAVSSTNVSEVIPISHLKVDSALSFSAKAYNIKYTEGVGDGTYFGVVADFHGTQSLYSGSGTVDQPSDNAIIEIENSKEFEITDDFTITSRIYIPTSQSVSQSFHGAYTGNDTYQDRLLKTHSKNIIATSKQWSSKSHAFNLSVFNGTSVNNGKLQFTQKSTTNGKVLTLTSNAAFNDNQWHNICIVGASVANTTKMFVDGTMVAYIADSMGGFNTKANTLITLGARRYGYKSKYRNKNSGKWTWSKDNRNYIQPFSGSIDYFNIRPHANIDANIIACFSASLSQTDLVGNVMYEHGIMFIHSPKSQHERVIEGNGGDYSSSPISSTPNLVDCLNGQVVGDLITATAFDAVTIVQSSGVDRLITIAPIVSGRTYRCRATITGISGGNSLGFGEPFGDHLGIGNTVGVGGAKLAELNGANQNIDTTFTATGTGEMQLYGTNGSTWSNIIIEDLNPSFELTFRGTHVIKEHIYICNVLDGEYNSTYNPTARVKFDARNDNLQAYTTHSEFNPYVTTIGLYDDKNNLCAVGKLAQPIKNQDDYDNTFQVRFDTTI